MIPKPCPFCGKELREFAEFNAEYWTHPHVGDDDGDKSETCLLDGFSFSKHAYEGLKVVQWNRRAEGQQ